MDELPSSYEITKHPTTDTENGRTNGSLIPVWHDYSDKIKNSPKMVYVTSVSPNEKKGPHLHLERNSHFICIHGKVMFVIRDEVAGEYIEIESSAEHPVMVSVPKGFASAHINLSKETSHVLTLADKSWKPNDNEMKNVTFEGFNWKKFL